MVEFCFEGVNWSPFVGFETPNLKEMIAAAAAAGYRWITLDKASIAYITPVTTERSPR
jgi:hypothetical protein